ncbi:MAG: hypothetical protein Q7K57_22810 [Burkholderiaceae bacterium]|nr:hypothetical protein [Burkholderiaceae bacterium]
MLGLDFAKIERKINPHCAVERDDKGGYRQPQLWRKYGAGEVCPIGNGHGDHTKPTAVIEAEQYAPGSSDMYHAALWGVLGTQKLSISAAKKLCENIATPVADCLQRRFPQSKSLWVAVLALDDDALNELEGIRHIDALAVMLLYMKFIRWNTHIVTAECIQRWFQMMVDCDHAFAVIELRLKALLVDYDFRLFRPKRNLHISGDLRIKPPRKAVSFLGYFLEKKDISSK